MDTRFRILIAALAVALAAAACSGDDGETVGEVSETTADPSEAPETTAPGETPDTTGGSETLTASFRGVTETTIKVGVTSPDFDALQAAGIGNYQGDAEIAFQAFFDVINEAGGIHGRQIEPVYVPFEWTNSETQDIACSKFVEDHEVFIVLYGLLGPSNLCLAELHDTMVITRSFQTAELREQAGDTVWLQLNAADDARTRIFGSVLAESGRLDGKTIGITTGETQTGGSEGETLQQVLEEHGIESTLVFTPETSDDAVARESALRLIAERLESEGVDFLFDLSGGGNIADVFADVGFTPEIAYKALGPSVDGARDRSLLDGAISVSEINEQAIFDDPDFQANCMDVVRDANPDLVEEMSFLPSGDEQGAGMPNWVNPVMIACDQTMLLTRIGEIAGADLTNDSFRAALDELGPIELHGYGQASFDSTSKWDGLDEFWVQEYDFETETISVVGDSIIVDR